MTIEEVLREMREALLTYARLASASTSGMAKLIEGAYPRRRAARASCTK